MDNTTFYPFIGLWYLTCFCLSAIINITAAALNFGVHVSFGSIAFLGICSRVGFMGHEFSDCFSGT